MNRTFSQTIDTNVTFFGRCLRLPCRKAIGQTSGHAGHAIHIMLHALTALLFLSTPGSVHGCGGCFSLPYQSLLEKVERADRVVIARTTNGAGSPWKIDRVIKGRKLDSDEDIDIEKMTGQSKMPLNGAQLLLWNEVLDSWTIEAPPNRELIEFLNRALALQTFQRQPTTIRQQSQQLRFFLPYIEHPDSQIADSTHAKLSGAPYAVLRELSGDLDREQLLKWIDDHSAAINKRVALFVMLLGICGDQREADRVKDWIDQGYSGGEVAYLTALLTAHIELSGEQAVRFIEESYLQNGNRRLGEVIAAVDALRTHGQAETTISRDRIKASFHLFLRERTPLAELVIDDFARWKDWSIAPQLMEIQASGKQPWNTT
ncbi:MAG: hypothetical protein ACR2NU_12875, partial [Aeoliella sp.]